MPDGMCKLTFHVVAPDAGPGTQLAISGSHLALGNFFQAVPLVRTPGTSEWTLKVTVPRDVKLSYKYLLMQGQSRKWESIAGNRHVTPVGPAMTQDDEANKQGDDDASDDASEAAPKIDQDFSVPLQRSVGNGKLLFVMYCLPVDITKSSTGEWQVDFNRDNFLARTRSSVAEAVPCLWVGFVTSFAFADGANALRELTDTDREILTRLLAEIQCIPVWASVEDMQQHELFCAAVLWPAMHNVMETDASSTFDSPGSSSQDLFLAYEKINRIIADAVRDSFKPSDLVWVHDYELFLVPQMLVTGSDGQPLRCRPAIAFYLHAPFPTSEIFRCLSCRERLLLGVLEANVVGFHTFNYARHFMTSCKRLLGVEFKSRKGGRMSVELNGRRVVAAISHVGVCQSELQEAMRSEEAADVARYFTEKYPGKRIIASVDKCERLRGVVLKLLAIENLVTEFRGSTGFVLVQRCETRNWRVKDVAISSREIRDLVDRINSKHPGIIDYDEAPTYSMEFRVGLYHCADVWLQTPIREGLNMRPMEYVFCHGSWLDQGRDRATGAAAGSSTASTGEHERKAGESRFAIPTTIMDTDSDAAVDDEDAEVTSGPVSPLTAPLPAPRRPGCVVMSEFSTASQVLSCCTPINPYGIAAVAEKLDAELSTPASQRTKKLLRDFGNIAKNPMSLWTQHVLLDVLHASHDDEPFIGEDDADIADADVETKQDVPGNARMVVKSRVAELYKAAHRRVILLSYSGTLVEREGSLLSLRHLVEPPHLTDSTLSTLVQLAKHDGTFVFVFPPPDGLPIVEAQLELGVIANDGVRLSWGDPNETTGVRQWQEWSLSDPALWALIQQRACTVMNRYAQRVNGSFVRVFRTRVSWDFSRADPEWGISQTRFLAEELTHELGSWVNTVVQVNKTRTSVDVSVIEMTKSRRVKELLAALRDVDFVLAIGNHFSDDQLFEALERMRDGGLQSPIRAPSLSPSSTPGRPVSMPATFTTPDSGTRDRRSSLTPPSDAEAMPSLTTVLTVKVGDDRGNARQFISGVPEVHDLLSTLASSL